jgi:plastocyanin
VRAAPTIRLIAAAALGVAAVALPATAASEGSPTIENEDPSGGGHHWKPPTATVEAGGVVVFKNTNASVPHGIHWNSTPATPTCDSSVPVGSASATSWSGNCTFTVPGTYTFYCSFHGPSMSGTIVVTGPPAPGKAPSAETTPPGTGTGAPPGFGPTGGGSGSPSGGPAPSATAASAAALSALRLAVPRHGGVLHGSLLIPAADASGRLQVELLAARSALTAGTLRVGQLVRNGIAAGRLAFTLTPSARALRSLRRRGSLKLTMTARLQAASGAGASVSRRLTLHR